MYTLVFFFTLSTVNSRHFCLNLIVRSRDREEIRGESKRRDIQQQYPTRIKPKTLSLQDPKICRPAKAKLPFFDCFLILYLWINCFINKTSLTLIKKRKKKFHISKWHLYDLFLPTTEFVGRNKSYYHVRQRKAWNPFLNLLKITVKKQKTGILTKTTISLSKSELLIDELISQPNSLSFKIKEDIWRC